MASTSRWHGRLGAARGWALPVRTVTSAKKSRPEYTSVEGHEYRDTAAVLQAKVEALAGLLRRKRCCVAYTGAGLSVASGLDDYATNAPESLAARPRVSPERGSGYLAVPNAGHVVLARLHAAGLLRAVVNQNHDGLLQKAGMPQGAVNEIHGSWFDPSNPGGNLLRDDLFASLLRLEAEADLCLALGTSLSGLNADRVATTPAGKFPDSGLVIVALQATQLDEQSALRIFAPLDEVLGALAAVLSLPALEAPPAPKRDRFELPYDAATGARAERGGCSLDLTPGARIRILRGTFAGCKGVVGEKNAQGHYAVQVFQTVPIGGGREATITDDHLLGSWWLTEAQGGRVPFLPVVQDEPPPRARAA